MRKHPGEFLTEYMSEKSISREELAASMDVGIELVNSILDERITITFRIAKKLGAATNMRPFAWMQKQVQFGIENDDTDTSKCSVLRNADGHASFTRNPERYRILWADFGDDGEYQPPEIRKHRPVVVLSKKNRNQRLVTVASISTVRPEKYINDNVFIPAKKYPGMHRDSWIKMSLITSISTERLYYNDSNRNKIMLDEDDQKSVISILGRLLPFSEPIQP